MKNFLLTLTAILFISTSILAQDKDKSHNLNKNNIAIRGYDPVAYFTENMAVKGKKEYAVKVNDVVYYTSSSKNRELLQKNPEMYEPQYGGWCAYAMGDDGTYVCINPKAFEIIDGKLYLFYKNILSNTKKKWDENEAELKQQADQNWKEKMKMQIQ